MSGARHLVFLFFVAGAAEALTTIEVQLRRGLGLSAAPGTGCTVTRPAARASSEGSVS